MRKWRQSCPNPNDIDTARPKKDHRGTILNLRPTKYFQSRWLWQVPLALLILYCLALISFSSEPRGAVSSYAIFAHDPADVIEFKNGVVMHRTCCGDYPWGTYANRADGRWIWTLINKKRHTITSDGRRLPWWQIEPGSHQVTESTTHEVELHPDLLSVRLSCDSEPRYNCKLRRRVFWRFPL